MRRAKAEKPKSNITIHECQEKNPIIKDFFFMYNKSKDIHCHFQIDLKYYCYFCSLRYYEKDSQFLSSLLESTSAQTSSKPRFLFLLFDYVFPKDKSPLQSRLSQINVNLFKPEEQSDKFFTHQKIISPLGEHEEKIEKMLLDINLLCFKMDVCLIVCFSGKDVAKYVYNLSMLDNDKYKAIKKRFNPIQTSEELVEALCYIDLIKKKDAENLLEKFQSIRQLGLANKSSMTLAPKITDAKANSIEQFFNYDFKHLSNQ